MLGPFHQDLMPVLNQISHQHLDTKQHQHNMSQASKALVFLGLSEPVSLLACLRRSSSIRLMVCFISIISPRQSMAFKPSPQQILGPVCLGVKVFL